MAQTYLDFAGLQHYDQKLKASLANPTHSYTVAQNAAKNWYRLANAAGSQTDTAKPLHVQFLVTAWNSGADTGYYLQWFVDCQVFGRNAGIRIFGNAGAPFSQIRVLYENTIADIDANDRPAIDLYLNYVLANAATNVKVEEIYNSGWTFVADGALAASTVPTGFENVAAVPLNSGIGRAANSTYTDYSALQRSNITANCTLADSTTYRGRVLNCTNAITVTVPSINSVWSWFIIKNFNAIGSGKNVTIHPSTTSVLIDDSNADIVLAPGEYVLLHSKAANSYTRLMDNRAYQGATSSAAGRAGLVPAATSAQKDNFLRGDGTWQEITEGEAPYVLTAEDPETDQSGTLDNVNGLIFYVPELNMYTWNVTLSVDRYNTIPIPFCLYATSNTSIEVDWGDGTIETFTSENAEEDVFPTHFYIDADTYSVSIKSSNWDSIYIADCRTLDLDYWKSSLTAVSNPLPHLAGTHTCGDSYTDWAHIPNVLQYTFYGCYNLASIPEDLYKNNPQVTSLSHAFAGCKSIQTIPQNLLAYPNVVSNLNNFMSIYYFGDVMALGSFNIVIMSPNVNDAAGFTDAKNGTTRKINVVAGTTTATTFNAMASGYGYTIVAMEAMEN